MFQQIENAGSVLLHQGESLLSARVTTVAKSIPKKIYLFFLVESSFVVLRRRLASLPTTLLHNCSLINRKCENTGSVVGQEEAILTVNDILSQDLFCYYLLSSLLSILGGVGALFHCL